MIPENRATGARQMKVIQLGSLGWARTAIKIIRQISAHNSVILIK